MPLLLLALAAGCRSGAPGAATGDGASGDSGGVLDESGGESGGGGSDSGDTSESGADSSETGTDTAPDTGGQAEDRLLLGALAGHNLVVIHVDTLRADHLPDYGYARDTTPHLRSRPRVVLRGIQSASSWTVPSTASFVTSQPPHVHRLTTVSRDEDQEVLQLDVPTWAEHLSGLGFATASFAGNPWVGGDSDLHAGFATNRLVLKDSARYNSAELVDEALAWVDGTSSPFFLFLQPMDMHDPYWVAPVDLGVFGSEDPPFPLGGDWAEQRRVIQEGLDTDEEAMRAALIAVYDEQLLGLDRGIETLVDGLDARGLLDDTVVVVTADHGETLDDAGDARFGHGDTLRDELTAVPLVVLAPGLGGATLDCVGMNVDTMPTVLAAMGVPLLDGIEGRDLRAGCRAVARTSLWSNPITPRDLRVRDGSEAVARHCAGMSGDAGFNLAADPAGLHALHPTDMTDGRALQADLDTFAAEIAAGLGGRPCSHPE